MLAALTGAANADELPKEFIGTWCGGPESSVEKYLHKGFGANFGCGNDNNWVTFTAKGYFGQEKECRFISIKSWRGWNEIHPPKEMDVPIAGIEARCVGEASQWRERLTVTISITKEMLILRYGR
jgi:hypothetical protein